METMDVRARERRPGSMASIGISHVGLSVRNMKTTADFYRDILGLDCKPDERGVARVPTGPDRLVLHEKTLASSSFHFGFHLDSFSKLEEWRGWLKNRKIAIFDEVTEEKYRSLKIRDPDGHSIEIFRDERAF